MAISYLLFAGQKKRNLESMATPPSLPTDASYQPPASEKAGLPSSNGSGSTSVSSCHAESSKLGGCGMTLLNSYYILCMWYLWPDALVPEEILSQGLDGMPDAGGENFDQLFGRFSEMKGTFYIIMCMEYIPCSRYFWLSIIFSQAILIVVLKSFPSLMGYT